MASKDPPLLQFTKISVQKDTFHFKGRELSDTEFLSRPEKEADVVHFKRIKIDGETNFPSKSPFQLIIELRSNLVKVVATNCSLSVENLVNVLNRHLPKFHRPAPPERYVDPVERAAKKHWVCTVQDGLKMAAVIHEIRDQGGLAFTLEQAEGR